VKSISHHLFQFSSHEPLPDFFGAATNIVEFGVTPKPSTHVVVDIPVASMQLDALVSSRDSAS
jgi:hypothetical protein